MTKKYGTATAFRTALEERLKHFSKKHGIDLHKLRRQVAFDRLLCRLFRSHPGNLFLKGGYSMELRIQKARTTKDIDLVLRAKTLAQWEVQDQEIFDLLQDAAREDLSDFFVFMVGSPTLDLEAVPYGGSRFPIEAHLDGRLFIRFPMDVVVSSLVLEPIEEIDSQNWMEFAGVEAMPFPAISKEQQFAEKFHAYTLPRDESENSRVKDLVDLILLIRTETLKTDALKTAVSKIFEYRGTHQIPQTIDRPPANWEPKFNKLVKDCGLDCDMRRAFEQVEAFTSKIR
ncbi:MAG: nucleotidyl transferase AbiEii/AbiGii toxin family protein [Deltaproteobacteria bacterium]|nr:nucleotidyl transferase AbiEii/AbiGii toxin family protein [Deltaproteobacteria bacterium]